MHHKKHRPKSRRAGCLLKPTKMSGWPKHALGHAGFGKLKREIVDAAELRRPS
jgi:hypothetical protein